jgi:hypothetical protein
MTEKSPLVKGKINKIAIGINISTELSSIYSKTTTKNPFRMWYQVLVCLLNEKINV